MVAAVEEGIGTPPFRSQTCECEVMATLSRRQGLYATSHSYFVQEIG